MSGSGTEQQTDADQSNEIGGDGIDPDDQSETGVEVEEPDPAAGSDASDAIEMTDGEESAPGEQSLPVAIPEPLPEAGVEVEVAPPMPTPEEVATPTPPVAAADPGLDAGLEAGGSAPRVADRVPGSTAVRVPTPLDSVEQPAAPLFSAQLVHDGAPETSSASPTSRSSAITPVQATAPVVELPKPTFFESLVALPGTFVSGIIHLVTAALAPVIGPGAPLDTPSLWGALLLVGRQFDRRFANHTPALNPDQTSQDLDDGQVHGTFGGTDADGDTLTYSVPTTGLGAPAHGTVTIDQAAGTYTYTPTAGYVGEDSFTVIVTDGAAGSHVHALGQTHTAAASVNVDVAAPVNSNDPPVVTNPPPPSDPDPVSGDVTGSLGVVDPDGDPLTIEFVEGGEPAYGTVTFDPVAGTYVYTPNQAGQLRVALGLGGTDSFTVRVTQGQQQAVPIMFAARLAQAGDGVSTLAETGAGFDEQVTILNIPIKAANLVLDGGPIPVGNGPMGIVVTGDYAYVVNHDNGDGDPNTYFGSVTVLDITDNHVVTTIPVGQAPTFAVLSGNNVYVVNQSDGTLSVIDTTSNTVVKTIPVAPDTGLATPMVSPDGKRLYITHPEVGPFANPPVHSVYVVDIDPDSPNFNSVVDTDPTTPQIDPITVTATPGFQGDFNAGLAMNEDSTRLYVISSYQTQINGQFGQSANVVVIDTDPGSATYNQVIGDSIALDRYSGQAAVSGNRLYVATTTMQDFFDALFGTGDPKGTVTVVDIDPASPAYNTVIDVDPSTPEIDRIAIGSPAFNLVVSPDGSLGYVLNVAKGTVTVVDLIANKAIDLDPTTAKLDGLVYRSDANAADIHDVLAVSPDGNTLYIAHPSDNTVSVAKFV